MAEFYFDKDPAAEKVELVAADVPDRLEQLMRQRERGRRVIEANLQLADIALAEGRKELAGTLYAEAMAGASSGNLMGRRTHWNAGWGHWRMGEPDKALALWLVSLRESRAQPDWAPPTLAVALWELGRNEEAVAWYAAAVRTEPGQWADAGNHAVLLPGWQQRELQVLAQVHQAWVGAPPAWP